MKIYKKLHYILTLINFLIYIDSRFHLLEYAFNIIILGHLLIIYFLISGLLALILIALSIKNIVKAISEHKIKLYDYIAILINLFYLTFWIKTMMQQ